MSKRAVYRTSNGRHHNVPYGPEVDIPVAHWKLATITQTATSHSAGAGGADADSEENTKLRQFQVKTWVNDADYVPVDDGDVTERITFKVREQQPVDLVEGETGDLSASDIRGAVGGEAIPGIASDTYNPDQASATDTPAAASAAPAADVVVGTAPSAPEPPAAPETPAAPAPAETAAPPAAPALSAIPAVGEEPAVTTGGAEGEVVLDGEPTAAPAAPAATDVDEATARGPSGLPLDPAAEPTPEPGAAAAAVTAAEDAVPNDDGLAVAAEPAPAGEVAPENSNEDVEMAEAT